MASEPAAGCATSEDDVGERVRELEELLAIIARECEVGLDRPDIAFAVVCRIAGVARRASEG